MKRSIDAGKLAEDACRKYPDEPSYRLARMLVAKHPEIFKHVDHARNRIRYYRGKCGKYHRSHSRSDRVELQRPNGTVWDGLPEPRVDLVWEPVQVTGERIAVLADLHVPWHDPRALRPALDFCLASSCDTVVLNGDVFDHYEESEFTRDRSKEFMGDSLRQGFTVLSLLRDAFPKSTIYYKLGNHEWRWRNWFRRHGREFFELGFTEFDWVLRHPTCFGWPSDTNLNLVYITDPVPLQIGALYVLHGHELPRMPAAVNPARGAFLKTGECCIVGHWHKDSSHRETTLADRLISCWSTGCLCTLHPYYLPINRWTHGFAIVTRGKGKNFRVENHTIHDGVVY